MFIPGYITTHWGDFMSNLAYSLLSMILVVSFITLFMLYRYRYTKTISENEYNRMLSGVLEEGFKNNSLSGVSQNILDILKGYYNVDYVSILVMKKGVLDIVASNIPTDIMDSLESFCNVLLKDSRDYSAKVFSSKFGVVSYEAAKGRGICFGAFMPLTVGGNVIGMAVLESKSSDVFADSKHRVELYDKVFSISAKVLNSVISTEKLVAMVSTDQLTGIYNRRFIDVALDEQIKQHKNIGAPFCVVLLDIDFFKNVNDTYGHAFGDVVLQEVAKYFKDNIPNNAWVARYGGEEFMLFFARETTAGIKRKLNSLREGLGDLKIKDGDKVVNVTASFGGAGFPSTAGSVKLLIEAADFALYASKRGGRNRITFAE